jgi:hypothetical protein
MTDVATRNGDETNGSTGLRDPRLDREPDQRERRLLADCGGLSTFRTARCKPRNPHSREDAVQDCDEDC